MIIISWNIWIECDLIHSQVEFIEADGRVLVMRHGGGVSNREAFLSFSNYRMIHF